MTVAVAVTETVYALAGTALGPFASVWLCEDLTQLDVWLDIGTGPGLLASNLYTVAGVAPLTSGLNVTLLAGAIPAPGPNWPANSRVILRRVTPQNQPTSLGTAVGFNPSNYEAAIDHLDRQIQEASYAIGHTLRAPPGDYPLTLPPSVTRANGILIFDTNGNPQAAQITIGGVITTLPSVGPGIAGNPLGVAGPVTALTGAQATSYLLTMTGDAGAGGARGLVPAPAAGDAASFKFLKADGTWAQGGYPNSPIDATAGAYSLVTGDRGRTKYFAAGATVTIPLGLPVGDVYDLVWKAGTGLVSPTGGVTLTQPAGNLSGTRTVTGPGTITLEVMEPNLVWVRGGVNVT